MARTQEQIEALLDRFESFIGDYDKADEDYRRGQWHDHYAEKLGPYEDKLKALNGEDFDLYKESFDEYHKDYSDFEPDEYVGQLVGNIDKLLDKLRGALGEDKVELESGPEGTEVVSHEDKGIEANAEEPAEDEMTSDGRAKKMKGWKSPSKSGGRDGHSGLPGSYPSDETTKEEPDDIQPDEYISEEEPDEMEEFIKLAEKNKPRTY